MVKISIITYRYRNHLAVYFLGSLLSSLLVVSAELLGRLSDFSPQPIPDRLSSGLPFLRVIAFMLITRCLRTVRWCSVSDLNINNAEHVPGGPIS